MITQLTVCNNLILLPMIPHRGCVKDSKPNNSQCARRGGGKAPCNDRVLLSVIEEAIKLRISLTEFLTPLFSFLHLSMAKKKKSQPHQTAYVLPHIPWGTSLAEHPRDNKGKDIKAHESAHKEERPRCSRSSMLMPVNTRVCIHTNTKVKLSLHIWVLGLVLCHSIKTHTHIHTTLDLCPPAAVAVGQRVPVSGSRTVGFITA